MTALAVALFALALPWDKPSPPPAEAVLVLTQPYPPEPPPEGSIMEVPADRTLPARWRTTADMDAKRKGHAGLSWLNASGSAQFDAEQFYALRQILGGRRVAVVDLREEPHTFLNRAAVTWGPPEVIAPPRHADALVATEARWTALLAAGKFATLARFAPGRFADVTAWEPLDLRLDIREALTEATLVAEAHWGYFRIAAPDTAVPRDQDVDRFVEMVRLLDEDIWLHFHCDTGGNRTTLFLTLYDMMRHYVRASRPEILSRQRRLNGIDPAAAGPASPERAAFLERFFSYCWQEGPLFRRSWSRWSRANP